MTKKVAQIFYLSFVVKLALAAFVPLSLDEMYYWLWGQHPQWSYFDHPPMVGWLMILGDLFRSIAEGAIRWPFVLMSQLTIWVWYLILKPLIDEKHIVLWLLVALLNPLWGLGGLIATPDIPLLFFWSLAFFVSQKLIEKPSWNHYALFGALLGLGFLSKYMIVLFPLCLLPWFYKDKLFHYLWNKKALVTLLAGFILCSPVLIWNYQNEFASLSFQWKHGTAAKVWKWNWSVEYLLGQVFLIFPFVFYLLFKNRRLNNQLFYFAAIPLLFFLITSFFNRVEANWPIVAYPAVYAIAFLKASEHTRFFKWMTGIWAGLLLFALALVVQGPQAQTAGKPLKVFEKEKFKEILRFSEDKPHILASSYQMAAYLSYERKTLTCKLPEVQGRVDFFNYLKPCKELPDQFHLITENRDIESVRALMPDRSVTEPVMIDEKYAGYRIEKR